MRAQKLKLIYSQSGLLDEIFLDVPRSILDKSRQNYGPHANGIVRSTQENSTDQLSNQLQQLLIQHIAPSQTSGLVVPPT
jgi:hypothetical protein